ncbi:MAG: VOC family protein [Gammaproteobacteria bacterium]|nr:VOC family protein [Gammaproteobacteria bacterium]MBV9697350.1 VOC family protein [Gammaproteobacteria bacterium]
MPVQAIPEGYHSLTPYLLVRGASAAIDYYRRAFGAVEVVRMPGPDDTVMHAEVRIGDCMLMLADENPATPWRAPGAAGPAVTLVLYVPDADQVFERAVGAGGKVERPLANQFYGDRTGTLRDPFGHVWTVATHVEDVSAEEMQRRMAAQK